MIQEEIEKRAYKVYPVDEDVEYDKYGNMEKIDLNEKRREGYIKCAEEYESLPKIHGWVATCSPNLFIDFSLPEASEILEKAGFKHGDKVEILIRKV